MAKGGDKARAASVRDYLVDLERCTAGWLEVLEGRFVWTRLCGVCRVWSRYGLRGRVLLLLFALPFHLGDPIVARLRKTA